MSERPPEELEEYEENPNQCLRCYNDIPSDFSWNASEYVCPDCDSEFPKLIHYLAQNNCELPEEDSPKWEELK